MFLILRPLVYQPGEYFVYSNVGPYIISALIQNELKINLMDWADELLFNPLGIKSFEWIKYGNYVAGCTGLSIGLQDLHKIATLLVNDGVYQRLNQIVSKNWINQLKSVHVYTPSAYDENSALPSDMPTDYSSDYAKKIIIFVEGLMDNILLCSQNKRLPSQPWGIKGIWTQLVNVSDLY